MTHQVRGSFDVTIIPQKAADAGGSRVTMTKTFHGPLDATGVGEMLAVQGGHKGSAAYVAMERITGQLEGREGSFALQHTGTTDRGASCSTITVVPDSGTGALAGIKGSFQIEVTEGQHFYIFDYSLRRRIKPPEAS